MSPVFTPGAEADVPPVFVDRFGAKAWTSHTGGGGAGQEEVVCVAAACEVCVYVCRGGMTAEASCACEPLCVWGVCIVVLRCSAVSCKFLFCSTKDEVHRYPLTDHSMRIKQCRNLT